MIDMKKSDDYTKLILIKLAHTLIWAILVAAILYVLYAGIFDSVGLLAWLCVGLVIVEGVILEVCKWKCPLTLLARKYTDNQYIGFDIFLPTWLAKYNKVIFSTLFSVGLALVLWRSTQ
ncbi:MAG: hypothetical protein FWE34_06440 [Defluviitaleaceae bacterium]|nr:hypothetical protein [Defluviitaleaceae bacterium]